MEIIFPHKISGEILDLIREAAEHLTIVSPYVDFWTRASNDLKTALKRGVRIDFYTRLDANNVHSWEQIESLGIKPRLIPNLHAKLYFNEKRGVISSMNLLSSSNNASIEIGCKLNTHEEIGQLRYFVDTFIAVHETDQRPDEEEIFLSKARFSEALGNYTNSRVYYKNGQFNVQTRRDQFFLSIDSVQNTLNFGAVLSENQADNFLNEFERFNRSKYFECKLIPGRGKAYNMVSAYSNTRLSTSFLDKLLVTEKKKIIHEIAELMASIQEFKASYS